MATRTAVSMAGGGHRACLFALGAMMYLADAGLTGRITSVASVSGGSFANGAIAQDLDLTACSAADVEATSRRAARAVVGRGTVFGSRAVVAYLIGVVLLLAAVVAATVLAPVPAGLRVLVFVVGLLLWGWVLSLRGHVTARAFGDTLFTRDGKRARLADVHRGVDHVICATDLHAGEHVFFSGGFVYSYRFGLGSPGDLPLDVAVQASAAFPGAFPVTWLRTARFGFRGGRPEAAGTRRLALHDGGVYDNMGDQWAQGLRERTRRLGDLNPGLREADELVVVSSSAGLEFGSVGPLGLPLIGELLTLLRDKSVLYDNGNSVRRRELVARFDLAEHEGEGLRGALVHIPQSPFEVPDAFADADDAWPDRAARARAALETLTAGGDDDEALRDSWREIARADAAVPTTLVGFKPDVAARLMHHAYVLAMANLHVILGHPLLAVPDRARFDALVA